ncbi:hypothetical protein L9F63_004058 [Diploptera punctata]|uniref:Gustatory receptor n=1 Tax=Diploptera punctata TaxID=6984 RepID=A0AAD7ZGY5_DIPPU|nr:hypothetical protein L9F63_004058 [Diploptera punctata]
MNPNNFISSIKPLYYVSRIVGLAPLSISSSCELREASIGWKIHTCCVLLLVIVSSSYAVMERVRQSDLVATVVVNEFLMMSMGAIKAITSIIMCLTLNRVPAREVLRKIVKIDSFLLTDPDVTYKNIFKFSFIQTIIVYVYVLSLFMCDTLVWTRAVDQMGADYLISGYPHRIVNITSVVEFCDFVLLLKSRIRALNSKLCSLLERASDSRNSSSKNDIANQKSIRNVKTPRIGPYVDSAKVFRQVDSPYIYDKELEYFHKLRELYDELCDVTRLINSMYGLLLLLELGVTTIELTSSLYLSLATLLKIQNVQINVIGMFSSLMFSWLILYSFKLICITMPSHLATTEMENTVVIVHKLLLVKQFDHSTITELKLFSQQLLQRKVKFSAFGFLNLDYSLLFTIIGGVTTYLVIAMQYKM